MSNFIEKRIEKDLADGHITKVQTRFPPEPNGYLHIGHAKALFINYHIAKKFDGEFNLRFDDTNPERESYEYINAIKEDIKWLGYHYDHIYYASDYFDELYRFASWLIVKGYAYIDEQISDNIAFQRKYGYDSPYRNRPANDSLKLFVSMCFKDVQDSPMVLRLKLDMKSPDIHFRDPIIYRRINCVHNRTDDRIFAYPMYDFAHAQSDYIEGVTHSLCTLEFKEHNPLYQKLLDLYIEYEKANNNVTRTKPVQIEFSKLNLTYTVLDKRYLKLLVDNGLVRGYDDPRLLTIAGMRNRGYTPVSIRNFVYRLGCTTNDSIVNIEELEYAVREDLNCNSIRLAAVFDETSLTIVYNDEEGKLKYRQQFLIEKSDARELVPGMKVRLLSWFVMRILSVSKSSSGEIKEVCAEFYKSGTEANVKTDKTIHCIGKHNYVEAEINVYDRLWKVDRPMEEINKLVDAGDDVLTAMKKVMNVNSVHKEYCKIERKILEELKYNEIYFQFYRNGYYKLVKRKDDILIMNKIISLK